MKKNEKQVRIFEASKKIFSQKGYAATTMRDISAEAGINLALINYYFKSKENLFKVVICDNLFKIFDMINNIISNKNIKLEDKIKSLTDEFTKLFLENDELALFILNEYKLNPGLFNDSMQIIRQNTQSIFDKELQDNNINISTVDFLMNIAALVIFPFITKQFVINSGMLTYSDFKEVIRKRQELIPTWVKSISSL